MANKKPSSKSKPKEANSGTPLCIAMLFCERTLLDQGGVVTAIRIIDNVTLAETPPKPHTGGTLLEMSNITLLVVVKKGEASGRFDMGVVSVNPANERGPVGLAQAFFDGSPESGANIIVPLRLNWNGPGLYWIELMVKNKAIARTPIRIKVEDKNGAKKKGKTVKGER